MTETKIADLTKGVANELLARPELLRVMSGNEIKETIPDTPSVQVYFQSKQTISPGGNDRISFGAVNRNPIRQTEVLIHCDLYVRQRSNIGDEMAKLEALLDVMDSVMESQNVTPFFGSPGVKSWNFRAERVTFEYNKVDYVGVRYYVTLNLI